MPLHAFHPAVARWFGETFPGPTEAQAAAWPAIMAGRNTLVAAPTGSGKTLTAFLAAIDALVREGLAQGGALPDRTTVVYVSPLKALSNDIRLNLEAPLAGIRAALAAMDLPDVEIRTAVRTGDTPQAERARARRRPPHILVTTPESLYVLLGSASGRAMLGGVRSVIVDEIHALAGDKRGSHLALSLQRLEALCGRPLVRIGLSATQKPVEEVARFLVGAARVYPHRGDLPDDRASAMPAPGDEGGRHPASLSACGEHDHHPAAAVHGGSATAGVPDCAIVDIGYAKQRDLALELPPTPLSAVMSNEQWEQVYQRLAELARAHRTTLVFVNTRRMAERAAFHLGQLLGREQVGTHHGSLSKELRLDAEQKLKYGQLRALVCTASLELGLDIGDVDLVCQIGSPRSIAAFLQRAGRSGHHVGGVPKARLFPQTRDELVECAALLDCVRRGELDALRMPSAPLDVLAQQIVAEVATTEWDEDALYDVLRGAWPYAGLERARFDEVVRMLADGFSDRRGPRAGWLHRDAVNRRLRGRQGARTVAMMSGGTIPETGDYQVLLEPQSTFIGSVNEDFAVESMAGDIFQLGNASYRILRIESGRVRVEDAQGMPPSIPFWLGEAPGRTDELSLGVSRLREEIASRLEPRGQPCGGTSPDPAAGPASTPPLPQAEASHAAMAWLTQELGLAEHAARQLVDYLGATAIALGAMPSQNCIVLERFFDETGATQLVIHSPYGSRLNRAWGLALRKRFCRQFNFELQAAATEDAIVLSLSTSHSFPLIEVARYLHSASAQDLLVQALLDAPLFPVRWRWNAAAALALPRFVGGKKVPPQLQRMKSEDLLATVFPDQVACLENIAGEREVPDHPLVAQTLDDCLHQAMDADGWLAVLRGLESGAIRAVARDLAAPSPLAAEALNARPYAFLDDAPLEERRTQAVQTRRYADPQAATDLGRLDAEAVAQVRAEAWPRPRNAEEMHEALTGLGFLTAAEAQATPAWPPLLQALQADARATRVTAAGRQWWVAAERLPQLLALHPSALQQPGLEVPPEFAEATWSADAAAVALLRARLTGLGPVTAAALADSLALAPLAADMALVALQSQGYAMQGQFAADEAGTQWCERHLLARIHRLTLRRLRREIEPVAPRDFMRFLFDWQKVAPDAQVSGPEALAGVLAQLEGYEAPAAAWEAELLPSRVRDYAIGWLDDLCTSGRTLWTRLRAADAEQSAARGPASLRGTPILLLPRRSAAVWTALAPAPAEDAALSSRAQKVADVLAVQGASFFDDLRSGTRLLQTELEDALAELVARGRVHCDSFAGLRALLVPASRRPTPGHGRRRATLFGIEDAGRWAPVRRALAQDAGGGGQVDGPRAGGGEPLDSGGTSTGTATVTDTATAGGARASAARPGRAARPDPEAVEHVARVLLRRYGVVCWRMLEREAGWLPPWRELLRVYHRLEARGEVRGGRFIDGLSGEQFALPEAVALLRKARHRPEDGRLVCVSASDPLNLSGIVVAGEKVPRIAGARVLYRDGMPVAALVAGEMRPMVALSPEESAQAQRQLLREPAKGVDALLAQLQVVVP